MEGPTDKFRCGLFFRSGFDRANEGSAIQIGGKFPATDGTTESKRHPPYEDEANFQTFGRLQIGYGNDSGTNNESGAVSMALGMLLVGR